jgi:hypothetical protein
MICSECGLQNSSHEGAEKNKEGAGLYSPHAPRLRVKSYLIPARLA